MNAETVPPTERQCECGGVLMRNERGDQSCSTTLDRFAAMYGKLPESGGKWREVRDE
jgi:hypothetical protein